MSIKEVFIGYYNSKELFLMNQFVNWFKEVKSKTIKEKTYNSYIGILDKSFLMYIDLSFFDGRLFAISNEDSIRDIEAKINRDDNLAWKQVKDIGTATVQAVFKTSYIQFLETIDFTTFYKDIEGSKFHFPIQKIYFGTPGSGKSHKVNEFVRGNAVGNNENIFRTTFHPDSDYATFVGCYKPTMVNDDIKYQFVPQTFTDAYIYAYKNPDKPIYLVIEEINRGNCAQIFGDLFQLLDRNEDGTSSYEINADKDLEQYLIKELGEESNGIRGGKLSLPANLSIIATMNTSDQSLFPMDSAFKRRWEWEYVPIELKDKNVASTHYMIQLGDKLYKWVEFLEKVNEKIKAITDSEDKQLGNFFVKGQDNVIDQELFLNKVMSYLWFEICKDNYHTADNFFRYKENETEEEFSFNDVFSRKELLPLFMEYLDVKEVHTL